MLADDVTGRDWPDHRGYPKKNYRGNAIFFSLITRSKNQNFPQPPSFQRRKLTKFR